MVAKSFKEYEKLIAGKSMRERVLIAAGVAVLIAWPVYFSIIDSNASAEKKVKSSISSIEVDLEEKKSELQTWRSRVTKNPNVAMKDEISVMEKQISDIDRQLDKGVASLVDASTMADILKKMLSTSGDIEVLSMENLPPKVLIQDEGEVNLFQHTVRVTFKGKYLDIMDHLKKIEKMNYKFYWHSIDYHVVKHPYSEVTIEVYTLSINKDFLHV